MLELKNICKTYETKSNTKVGALKNINVAFRDHEFVSILGPSGCGKTTLLNLIGGLDRCSSGEIWVDGKSTADFTSHDWDTYRNHKIGFVFQSYNLIPHQTVLENVELALTLSGQSGRKCKYLAMKALEKVGLANHLRKRPNELSGGEMQRVAIARAIVNNPEIILADEPTGALDSKTSVQIMDLLKEISKDRLVIMVTHNDGLANSYSTRIIKQFDGEIVYDSNPFNISKTSDLKDENKEKKTAMSFALAFKLSLKNLLTKKARTIMMAVASSIGIVGLALVLALFNGLNVFLNKVQYDTLSAYPMFVTTWATDGEEYISVLLDKDNYISNPSKKDKIFVSHLKTKLNSTTTSNNITPEFQEYIKNAPGIRDITYSYGTSFNIFKKTVSINTNIEGGTQQDGGIAVLPGGKITVQNASIPAGGHFKQLVGGKDFILSQYDMVAGYYPEKANELVLVLDKNNQITDSILMAFLMDVNATTKNEKGEFIVNEYDYDDFLGAKKPDGTREESAFGTFTLALNNGLYVKHSTEDQVNYFEKKVEKAEDQIKRHYGSAVGNTIIAEINKYLPGALPLCYSGKTDDKSTMNLKIVGIMRTKEETTTGSMGVFPIGYTPALTEFVVGQAENSFVVREQIKQGENLKDESDLTVCRNVLLNYNSETNEFTKNENIKDTGGLNWNLAQLGYSDHPTKIEFYATSFEGKMALKKYLADYNNLPEIKNDDSKKVYATDIVSTVIDVLKLFINTIVAILLSLTAISLIVAAIMIAIITYVSVIERTREIGILRSIGARKIDITSVFNAETVMIGLFAGLLGIVFALILQWPLNAILFSFTGISHLARLSPVHGLILVAVAVVITLLSGFIPAIMASKRDPVKALRSE